VTDTGAREASCDELIAWAMFDAQLRLGRREFGG